jgi:hypothetical protein
MISQHNYMPKHLPGGLSGVYEGKENEGSIPIRIITYACRFTCSVVSAVWTKGRRKKGLLPWSSTSLTKSHSDRFPTSFGFSSIATPYRLGLPRIACVCVGGGGQEQR